MKIFIHVVLVILLLQMHLAIGDKKQSKKYSREANEQQYTQQKQHKSKEKSYEAEFKLTTERYDPDFRNLQRPFRMAKLNLVWAKAQNVSANNTIHIPKLVKNLYE